MLEIINMEMVVLLLISDISLPFEYIYTYSNGEVRCRIGYCSCVNPASQIPLMTTVHERGLGRGPPDSVKNNVLTHASCIYYAGGTTPPPLCPFLRPKSRYVKCCC